MCSDVRPRAAALMQTSLAPCPGMVSGLRLTNGGDGDVPAPLAVRHAGQTQRSRILHDQHPPSVLGADFERSTQAGFLLACIAQ